MEQDIKTIIVSSELFTALSQSELEAFAQASRLIKVQKNETIFSRGATPDALYIINSGEIAIETISEHGKQARVATLGPQEMIGELAILNNSCRTADARATCPSVLLKIRASTFLSAIERNATFSMAVIRNLVARLCDTNDQIENISLRPLRIRLARLLIEFVDISTSQTPLLKVTQSELAERLAATREKVNIHLQALQKLGVISLQRGSIQILDAAALRKSLQKS